MKNAYLILGVSQDATKVEIVKGQIEAIKARKYSARDIAIAQKQLSTPFQRLAVDFTFPVLEEISKIQSVKTNLQIEEIDLDSINPNEFDPLK